MDKEIVIVVPTETAAYETQKALKALDDEGSIELYSSTVIAKSTDGKLTTKAKETRELPAPVGTALGLSTGALIGMLAGPVGAAVGAAAGGAVGLGGDVLYSGFAGDFVRDIVWRLKPGSYAVCASVWEDWTVPVDTVVAPLGGTIVRQSTDDIAMAQIRAAMQSLKEEQAHVESEIARAQGDLKAKLEAKRNELRAKQAAQRERLQKRANELQASWDARIANIKEKVSEAKADARTRHEQHKDKLASFAAKQKQAFQELFA